MASNDDNNNRNRDKHLFYLNELSDYKVKSDDPDVRGWEVKDVDKRGIGKVDNLLVNKNTERVVYLDVEVDKSIIEANHDPYRSPASEGEGVHEFMNKDGEEHLIIPIGLVKLDEDDKFVYTDKINHRTFAETKRMKKGSKVNREYEKVVLASYDRNSDSTKDRDKTSVDKNAVSGNRNRDTDKEIEMPKDTDTKTRNQPGKDLGDPDVSRTSSTSHDKDRESGKIDKDPDPGKSQSETGAISGRDRENEDEEDFYNKKDFDDSNYRKRK